MGCRILVGTECGEESQITQACFYCSTVGLAFGPMFDGEGFDGDPQKEAMAFIAYLEKEGVKDPRAIPNRELMAYFGTFTQPRCGRCQRIIDTREYRYMGSVSENCVMLGVICKECGDKQGPNGERAGVFSRPPQADEKNKLLELTEE